MRDKNGNRPQQTEAQLLQRKRVLKPFTKGFDPRRNLKGRPKSFEAFRALAQEIAAQMIKDDKTGELRSNAEAMLRNWAASAEPQLQRAFIEYAFGKVPDKIDTDVLDTKTTLILHYGHEREKRDEDHRRLSADVP